MLYQLSYGGVNGAEGSRTPDLRIANAALSQLSYSPGNHARFEAPPRRLPQFTRDGRERTRTSDLYDVNVAL